jgi:hypothetical protein
VETLRSLIAHFDALRDADSRFQDKHLALALGVTPPTVTGWRKLLRKSAPARGPNVAVREAIASLPDAGVLWGLERAVHEMRGTVDDLEAALEVRRELRRLAATPPAEDDPRVGLLHRLARGLGEEESG